MLWSLLLRINPLPFAGITALVLGMFTSEVAASPGCSRGNMRSSAYQLRPTMDRCEGIRGTRPIAATGLRLASFTIGEPRVQILRGVGEVFSLQVPVSQAGLPEPSVRVQAWRGNYLMEPIRLDPISQGWKGFSWGAGVIRKERISPKDLRATAHIKQPGDADQWMPVRFGPTSTYTLVIASNGPISVDSVFVVGPNRNVVKRCSGPSRIDFELRCLWKAANNPSGSYQIMAYSSGSREVLMNVRLRHDPHWLRH